MFQPMYETDALVLKTAGLIATPRGTVSASNAVLVSDSNYIITVPITLSAHLSINIMINNSPTASQDFVSPTYASTRSVRLSTMPIVNPNFEQNWIQIGTIPLNSLSSVVTNIPTRFLRLEGETFSAANTFYAFVWTQKMATGY